MAKLDRLVNVSIDLRTAAIRETSFSDAMLMGEADPAVLANRVTIITGADELLDLGIEATDPLYLGASDWFGQTPSTRQLYIGRKDAEESWTDALAAANGENSSFYGLLITSREDADILEVADWVEANKKLFFAGTASTGAIDPASTTDILAQLRDGNYFRTAGWYHAAAVTDFLDGAMMSRGFTRVPGSETYANQRLGGVTVDRLSETQAQAVLNKNGNTFEPFRNLSITQGGKVAAGEWIDVIRFRDWLEEQIKVNVFGLLVDNRVPYTTKGIGSIKSKIQESLDRGVRVGGIAPEEVDEEGDVIPSYRITVPQYAQVSFNDKANRTLKEVSFTARLSGAIHLTSVAGTLSYEL